jgi:threonyl-tRNA synthetase
MGMVNLIKTTYQKYGFDVINFFLSTRPQDAMGSDQIWQKATSALENALIAAGIPYKIQAGDGAFYGPKIDFKIEDSMGRKWQCGTIQVDFCQPENFDLSYVASGGAKERPVMIHRAIYGSIERFFGILLEHHKGNLPFWVAPVQVKILTITDAQKQYAADIAAALKKEGLRVVVDNSSEQISAQIKVAQVERVPWMLVLGKKEAEQNTVTLRYLDGKQEFGLALDAVIAKAKGLL